MFISIHYLLRSHPYRIEILNDELGESECAQQHKILAYLTQVDEKVD